MKQNKILKGACLYGVMFYQRYVCKFTGRDQLDVVLSAYFAVDTDLHFSKQSYGYT